MPALREDHRPRLVRRTHFLAGIAVGSLAPVIAGFVLGRRLLRWSL